MKQYAMAFILCVLLTFVAYFVVERHLFPSVALMAVVGVSFVLQAGLQFVYFLRLGAESAADGERWNTLFFLFTILIVLCIVLGSLWIMYNLDYRMM